MRLRGILTAKAVYYVITDAEVRKVGHRTGLDTPLFQSVNDADER